MQFLVRVGLRMEEEEGWKKVFPWGEIEVEAEEKWDALVQAVELLGISDRISMGDYWKGSSIKKKNRPEIYKRRAG